MDIVLCDKCKRTMVYAVKDIDGTNLEEVYECRCGNCIAYNETDKLFTLHEGNIISYCRRYGILWRINREYSLVYFPDTKETQELLNSNILQEMQ